MTQREIELIESTWNYIVTNIDEAGELFYNKLFVLRPELATLFKGDIKAQSKKLTSMITFLVNKLNSLDEVKKDIVALGMRHKNYKVEPDHYQTVGVALLWTLEQGLGSQWNEDVKLVWENLYSVLSNMMIDAAALPNQPITEESIL